MVQKVRYVTKSLEVKGPCDEFNPKRLINKGANIEQRPWTPTIRQGKLFAESPSPGPACVLLPPLVGGKVPDSKKRTGPVYSFGRKFKFKQTTIGPGPGEYNTTGLGKKGRVNPSAPTIRSRPQDVKAKLRIPAPGDYNVANAINNVLTATPSYTFGHKVLMEPGVVVPAPNVYTLPNVIGSKEGTIRSAPAFSITGRTRQRILSGHIIPGPGSYECDALILKRTQPKYTIRDKYEPPLDYAKRPGPGAYCPENYISHKSIPAPTMGIKHSPLIGKRNAYLIDRERHCREVLQYCGTNKK